MLEAIKTVKEPTPLFETRYGDQIAVAEEEEMRQAEIAANESEED